MTMPEIPYIEDLHYSKSLEQSIIGACVRFPEGYERVSNILSKDCFFYSHTNLLFGVLHDMWINGYPIDMLTVNDYLHEHKIKSLNGDTTAYYLMTVSEGIQHLNHLTYWAIKVREKYAKRELLKISYMGKMNDTDPFEQAALIEQTLKSVFEIKNYDDWKDASEVAYELLNHIENIEKNGEDFISTGIGELDKINGGFQRGDLVIIGARPSVGKSAFMGKIALHNALKNRQVALMPLEMPNKSVFARMASVQSGVEHWKINRAKLDDDAVRHLVFQTISDMSVLNISFCDNTDINISDIKLKVKSLKKKKGKLDLLIIDYLQLIGTDKNKNKNREQEVSELSRGLKVLAMQENVVIILLAQLNRKSEDRANKKPSMADLRESGAIEQDADIVMLLHRDEQAGIMTDAQGQSTDGQSDLICCKWRNGATVSIKLGFDKAKMKFYEYDNFKPQDYKEYF